MFVKSTFTKSGQPLNISSMLTTLEASKLDKSASVIPPISLNIATHELNKVSNFRITVFSPACKSHVSWQSFLTVTPTVTLESKVEY